MYTVCPWFSHNACTAEYKGERPLIMQCATKDHEKCPVWKTMQEKEEQKKQTTDTKIYEEVNA